MTDNINPSHYKSSPAKCECGRQIECIDVTRHMDFNLGNVMKYIWRYKHKDGLEGLLKAQWYLNDAIKSLQGNAPLLKGKPELDPKDTPIPGAYL